MKHCISVLLLAVLYCSTTAYASTVSQAQALEIAKDQFKNVDADYYLLNNNDDLNWTIFVDAAPLCGWNHDCYTITVPKQNITYDLNPTFSKAQFTFPPEGDYTPLDVKNRGVSDDPASYSLDLVNYDPVSNPYADNTYAIILSGGVAPFRNYVRYWNDCSFIYQVLSKQYHIPKNNIFPLISDGTDPTPDTRIGTGSYISQNLDLDGDGEPEIELAATKQNLTTVVNQITQEIQYNDHLFIYVIDHGGTYREGNKTGSTICLWNSEELKDYELANLLKPLTDANVNVNLVLGQCHSGGFIDPLSNIGCVVATACSAEEGSWASLDRPNVYDEFVYKWTKGIQKNGLYYNADENCDHKVSMQECFEYARANDFRQETPQFRCNHSYLGEDLALNYIPPSINLYIPDNAEDNATEPNSSTEVFWESPSIIVTTGVTSGTPSDMYDDYPGNATSREIYVNVINRGKEDYLQGKKVCLYWTKAGIGTNPVQWLGTDNDGYGPIGGIVGEAVINNIPAGTSRLVKVNWQVPSYLLAQTSGIQTIDYLATIVDNSTTTPAFSGKNLVKVLQNKNFAQKSISKFSKTNYSKSIKMNCYLPDPRETYTLEIRPQNTTAAKILSNHCLSVQMNGTSYVSGSDGNAGVFDGLNYENVYMSIPNVAQGSFSLKFTPTVFESNEGSAPFIIYLKDESGAIIAGHSLQMRTPNSGGIIELQSTVIAPGLYEIEATDAMLNDYAWTNQSGEEIGDESSVVVIQSAHAETYHVTAKDENGDICQGEITIEEANNIKSIELSDNEIVIIFNPSASAGDTLSLYTLFETLPVCNLVINEDIEKVTISTLGLKPGLYILSYTSRLGINEVAKFEIK